LDGSSLYVGGYFTSMGGQPRNHLAAVDAVTGTATSWNPRPKASNPDLGTYGSVATMTLAGPELYVGGSFSDIAHLPHSYLAGVTAATLDVRDHPITDGPALGAPRPNPFGGATTIPFTLTRGAIVNVVVYDIAGRQVATLANARRLGPGTHQLRFEAHALPNGVYLVEASADGRASTRRLVLVR
jgi:hypothetical protein